VTLLPALMLLLLLLLLLLPLPPAPSTGEGVGGVKVAGDWASGSVGVEAPASTVLVPAPWLRCAATAVAAARAALAPVMAAAVLRQAMGSMAKDAAAEGEGEARQAAAGRMAMPLLLPLAPVSEGEEGAAGEGAALAAAAVTVREKSQPLREEGGVGALGLCPPPPSTAPPPARPAALLPPPSAAAAFAARRAAWRARRDCTFLRALSLSRVAAACTAARSGEVKLGRGGRVGEKSAEEGLLLLLLLPMPCEWGGAGEAGGAGEEEAP
jgi:hypothetical protein